MLEAGEEPSCHPLSHAHRPPFPPLLPVLRATHLKGRYFQLAKACLFFTYLVKGPFSEGPLLIPTLKEQSPLLSLIAQLIIALNYSLELTG